MVFTKVWIFPVLTVTCSSIAIFGGYATGASLKHIPTFVPFISDGGALAPETCIFSEFLNLSAFFLVVTVYIRHRQIVEYYGHRLQKSGPLWRICSQLLMFMGIFSAIGLTVLANFSEKEEMDVHTIGATVMFFFALVYAWGQIIFCYIMTPWMTSGLVTHLRTLVIFIATVAMCLYELSLNGYIFVPKHGSKRPKPVNGILWVTPDSSYYTNYLVSTISEWVMVLLSQLYILSFTAELRFAYLYAPKVKFTPLLEDLQQLVRGPYDDDEITDLEPDVGPSGMQTNYNSIY